MIMLIRAILMQLHPLPFLSPIMKKDARFPLLILLLAASACPSLLAADFKLW